jgi:predicted O-linked N-acetylglucosamine transferase (SPINDLY family)
MDYYLSAEIFEPPDAQSNYTEKLVCLPGTGCCYRQQAVDPRTINPAQFGIEPGTPLLLSPGVPFKYAPQHDQVFVDIARALGKCRMVFFAHSKHELSQKLRQRIERAFIAAQLNFDDYCTFIPWQEKSDFYGLMHCADVFLDTIGFSGFNTAMQAVECGLPVVTIEGRFMRGRLASGILRRMGLDELVVNDSTAYVDLAVKLASNADYRNITRARIEASRVVVFNELAPVRALEEFLINVSRKRP